MKANPSTRGKVSRGFLREPPTSEQFERVTLGLDLGVCDFADRSGLMALAQIRGRCAQRNVRLRIVAISPSVYTVLRFTGAMHKLFTFADGAIGEPFPETPHSLESHA